GTALKVPLQRHFFGYGEVVLLGLVPVDKVHGLSNLARFRLYRHAVAQQIVDGVVVAIECATMVVGLGVQLVQGHADLRWRVAALFQPLGEYTFLDVAVTRTISPVAEIAIIEQIFIAKQRDDAVLGKTLGLSNVDHINRILPVSSSCIIACLISRALVSFAVSFSISASISERIAAIAICSPIVGGRMTSKFSNVGSLSESTVAFTEFSIAWAPKFMT